MNRQGWVQGTGWISWDRVREIVGDSTCVWSDLEGVHFAKVPEVAPLATHLWAWGDASWHRVRIDEGSAVLATLHDSELPAAEQVQVHEYAAPAWREPHVRTGEASGTNWLVAEVAGGAGFVFMRPGEDPEA